MLVPIDGPLTNACVIQNGRPPADFRPAGRKEPFILTAGRLWDGAKNVSTLAAIAPRLSWPVVAAGDARGPTGGTRAAGGLRMLGPLDAGDLAGWMGRAAIFASPARYEPFGLAVLEAALSGCGLVLGDIPTFRELWDGVGGGRGGRPAALADRRVERGPPAACGCSARWPPGTWRGGGAGPRYSPPRPATSRSGLPFWKRRCPVAGSCWATSRHFASFGTEWPRSPRPTTRSVSTRRWKASRATPSCSRPAAGPHGGGRFD